MLMLWGNPGIAAFGCFQRNTAEKKKEKNHRLMSLCMIAVRSAAHPLVKTCPAGGPMGERLCAGRK